MSKLDDILEFAPEHNTKQQIIDLMLDIMDDVDPFHTADWYKEMSRKLKLL